MATSRSVEMHPVQVLYKLKALMGDYTITVANEESVMETLALLEDIPITPDSLKISKLGNHLQQLKIKNPDSAVAARIERYFLEWGYIPPDPRIPVLYAGPPRSSSDLPPTEREARNKWYASFLDESTEVEKSADEKVVPPITIKKLPEGQYSVVETNETTSSSSSSSNSSGSSSTSSSSSDSSSDTTTSVTETENLTIEQSNNPTSEQQDTSLISLDTTEDVQKWLQSNKLQKNFQNSPIQLNELSNQILKPNQKTSEQQDTSLISLDTSEDVQKWIQSNNLQKKIQNSPIQLNELSNQILKPNQETPICETDTRSSSRSSNASITPYIFYGSDNYTREYTLQPDSTNLTMDSNNDSLLNNVTTVQHESTHSTSKSLSNNNENSTNNYESETDDDYIDIDDLPTFEDSVVETQQIRPLNRSNNNRVDRNRFVKNTHQNQPSKNFNFKQPAAPSGRVQKGFQTSSRFKTSRDQTSSQKLSTQRPAQQKMTPENKRYEERQQPEVAVIQASGVSQVSNNQNVNNPMETKLQQILQNMIRIKRSQESQQPKFNAQNIEASVGFHGISQSSNIEIIEPSIQAEPEQPILGTETIEASAVFHGIFQSSNIQNLETRMQAEPEQPILNTENIETDLVSHEDSQISSIQNLKTTMQAEPEQPILGAENIETDIVSHEDSQISSIQNIEPSMPAETEQPILGTETIEASAVFHGISQSSNIQNLETLQALPEQPILGAENIETDLVSHEDSQISSIQNIEPSMPAETEQPILGTENIETDLVTREDSQISSIQNFEPSMPAEPEQPILGTENIETSAVFHGISQSSNIQNLETLQAETEQSILGTENIETDLVYHGDTQISSIQNIEPSMPAEFEQSILGAENIEASAVFHGISQSSNIQNFEPSMPAETEQPILGAENIETDLVYHEDTQISSIQNLEPSMQAETEQPILGTENIETDLVSHEDSQISSIQNLETLQAETEQPILGTVNIETDLVSQGVSQTSNIQNLETSNQAQLQILDAEDFEANRRMTRSRCRKPTTEQPDTTTDTISCQNNIENVTIRTVDTSSCQNNIENVTVIAPFGLTEAQKKALQLKDLEIILEPVNVTTIQVQRENVAKSARTDKHTGKKKKASGTRKVASQSNRAVTQNNQVHVGTFEPEIQFESNNDILPEVIYSDKTSKKDRKRSSKRKREGNQNVPVCSQTSDSTSVQPENNIKTQNVAVQENVIQNEPMDDTSEVIHPVKTSKKVSRRKRPVINLVPVCVPNSGETIEQTIENVVRNIQTDEQTANKKKKTSGARKVVSQSNRAVKENSQNTSTFEPVNQIENNSDIPTDMAVQEDIIPNVDNSRSTPKLPVKTSKKDRKTSSKRKREDNQSCDSTSVVPQPENNMKTSKKDRKTSSKRKRVVNQNVPVCSQNSDDSTSVVPQPENNIKTSKKVTTKKNKIDKELKNQDSIIKTKKQSDCRSKTPRIVLKVATKRKRNQRSRRSKKSKTSELQQESVTFEKQNLDLQKALENAVNRLFNIRAQVNMEPTNQLSSDSENYIEMGDQFITDETTANSVSEIVNQIHNLSLSSDLNSEKDNEMNAEVHEVSNIVVSEVVDNENSVSLTSASNMNSETNIEITAEVHKETMSSVSENHLGSDLTMNSENHIEIGDQFIDETTANSVSEILNQIHSLPLGSDLNTEKNAEVHEETIIVASEVVDNENSVSLTSASNMNSETNIEIGAQIHKETTSSVSENHLGSDLTMNSENHIEIGDQFIDETTAKSVPEIDNKIHSLPLGSDLNTEKNAEVHEETIIVDSEVVDNENSVSLTSASNMNSETNIDIPAQIHKETMSSVSDNHLGSDLTMNSENHIEIGDQFIDETTAKSVPEIDNKIHSLPLGSDLNSEKDIEMNAEVHEETTSSVSENHLGSDLTMNSENHIEIGDQFIDETTANSVTEIDNKIHSLPLGSDLNSEKDTEMNAEVHKETTSSVSEYHLGSDLTMNSENHIEIGDQFIDETTANSVSEIDNKIHSLPLSSDLNSEKDTEMNAEVHKETTSSVSEYHLGSDLTMNSENHIEIGDQFIDETTANSVSEIVNQIHSLPLSSDLNTEKNAEVHEVSNIVDSEVVDNENSVSLTSASNMNSETNIEIGDQVQKKSISRVAHHINKKLVVNEISNTRPALEQKTGEIEIIKSPTYIQQLASTQQVSSLKRKIIFNTDTTSQRSKSLHPRIEAPLHPRIQAPKPKESTPTLIRLKKSPACNDNLKKGTLKFTPVNIERPPEKNCSSKIIITTAKKTPEMVPSNNKNSSNERIIQNPKSPIRTPDETSRRIQVQKNDPNSSQIKTTSAESNKNLIRKVITYETSTNKSLEVVLINKTIKTTQLSSQVCSTVNENLKKLTTERSPIEAQRMQDNSKNMVQSSDTIVPEPISNKTLRKVITPNKKLNVQMTTELRTDEAQRIDNSKNVVRSSDKIVTQVNNKTLRKVITPNEKLNVQMNTELRTNEAQRIDNSKNVVRSSDKIVTQVSNKTLRKVITPNEKLDVQMTTEPSPIEAQKIGTVHNSKNMVQSSDKLVPEPMGSKNITYGAPNENLNVQMTTERSPIEAQRIGTVHNSTVQSSDKLVPEAISNKNITYGAPNENLNVQMTTERSPIEAQRIGTVHNSKNMVQSSDTIVPEPISNKTLRNVITYGTPEVIPAHCRRVEPKQTGHTHFAVFQPISPSTETTTYVPLDLSKKSSSSALASEELNRNEQVLNSPLNLTINKTQNVITSKVTNLDHQYNIDNIDNQKSIPDKNLTSLNRKRLSLSKIDEPQEKKSKFENTATTSSPEIQYPLFDLLDMYETMPSSSSYQDFPDFNTENEAQNESIYKILEDELSSIIPDDVDSELWPSN